MDYRDLTIIVPTLNERYDIATLLGRLASLYNGVNVIVADDGSTDGTREAILRAHGRHPHVSLFERRGKPVHGLTASVVDAATHVNTRYMVVMDGDMQHPPEVVGRIYNSLTKGNSLVVGTRTHVRDWELDRRLISNGITALSLVVFTLKGRRTVRDMMSGFFGIETKLFKDAIRLHRERFVPTGYKVLLDILNTTDSGIRIDQIPYKTFHRRKHGKSKFSTRQAIDVLKSIAA